MEKTNEILTIAGERVEVRYESDFYEACSKCCFHNIFVRCNVQTLCHGCPCEKYSDYENRCFAYFVPVGNTEAETTKQAQTVPSDCPTIKGWIARNKRPDELIFVPGNEAPTRMLNYWLAGFAWGYAVIPNVFPDLTWEDEPIEVELPVIVKKKK